jgi:hypothetical protein
MTAAPRRFSGLTAGGWLFIVALGLSIVCLATKAESRIVVTTDGRFR